MSVLSPSQEERVQLCTRKLTVQDHGLASLLLHVDYKAADKSVPAMAYTDGTSIYLAPKFFDDLKIEEQMGVLVHEILHIALRHTYRAEILRRRFRDKYIHMVFNIAADVLINDSIRRQSPTLALPQGVAYAENFLPSNVLSGKPIEQWTMEEIFMEMLKNVKVQKMSSTCPSCGGTGQKKKGDGSGSGSGKGQKGKQKGQNGSGGGQEDQQQQGHSCGDSNCDGGCGQDGTEPCPDCGGTGQNPTFGGMGGDLQQADPTKVDDGQEEATMQKWQSRLDRAAQGSKAGGLLRGIMEQFPKVPVDWKRVLREFVSSRVMPETEESWTRPSRRSLAFAGMGTPLPYIEPGIDRKRGVKKIGIVVDTSGSIGDKTMAAFLGVCNAIMQQVGCQIVLVDCDAAVHQVTVHTKPITKYTPKGGGGTDFRPAFKALDKEGEIACAVYLTDMYGTFPDKPPKYPVLWAAISDVQGPFGKTVRLPVNDEY